MTDRKGLSIIRTGHGAGCREAGRDTAAGIAAEQEHQRGRQTGDDGFEVQALPWRSVIPQASVFYGHASTEACGASRPVFAPRPVNGRQYARRSALIRS